MMCKIRSFLLKLWTLIPVGYLLRYHDGNNEITILKNLWVSISDGKSTDMLPLNFCSQEFVDDVDERLKVKYGVQ